MTSLQTSLIITIPPLAFYVFLVVYNIQMFLRRKSLGLDPFSDEGPQPRKRRIGRRKKIKYATPEMIAHVEETPDSLL